MKKLADARMEGGDRKKGGERRRGSVKVSEIPGRRWQRRAQACQGGGAAVARWASVTASATGALAAVYTSHKS